MSTDLSTNRATDTAPVKIVSNRERLSGVVQAVGRRPADIARRRWESFAILAIFLVVYTAIGYWLVVQMHVVGFETLDRFDRGLMIFHNEPPKLSSIGFDYPPLSVVLVSPFTVVPALARSLVVIPVVSAIFGALTMVVVNTMMRRAQVVFPMRAVVLATLGLNPLVVMYAADGARTFLWLSFVVAALGSLFAWYVTADLRFVMIAGLSFAVAALTGYGSLMWFVISLIMVAAILARLGADGTEIEGTTVGFASPTVYVIALWSAFNLILLFRPLAWLTESSDTASSGGLGDFSITEIARGTLDLLVYGAPIAIVVLPALIFAGIARRNGFALWLGLMLFMSIIAPGIAVVVRVTDSPLLMSNALPILFVSVIGAVWLARSSVGRPSLVVGLLAVGLLLSIPWTFRSMETFEHQSIERAFHDAVATGGSQEGALTIDGSVVGYADEQDMADFIRANVSGEAQVLTDNAQTYAVILLTGEPATFFDRVGQSDGPWRRAARNPAAHVDYMLLSVDLRSDLLSRLYPDAAVGVDRLLDVVHGNDRYMLVRVPPAYTYGDRTVAEDADANGVRDTDEAPVQVPDTDQGDPGTDPENPDIQGGYDGILGEPGPITSVPTPAGVQP